MIITLLSESGITYYLWVKVVNLTCYVLNGVSIRSIIKKNTYELWIDGRSNVAYFHIFSYKYFVLKNVKDNLNRFKSKLDEEIFLRYSFTNKVYRIYHKRRLIIEESTYIIFDEFYILPRKDSNDDAWNILEVKRLYIIKEVEIIDNTKLES